MRRNGEGIGNNVVEVHTCQTANSRLRSRACVCVCGAQLVRLLFWNRHSTEQRVDLDHEDLSSSADTTRSTSTSTAAAASGCVNTAYTADDETAANSQLDHRHHGLSVSLFSLATRPFYTTVHVHGLTE